MNRRRAILLAWTGLIAAVLAGIIARDSGLRYDGIPLQRWLRAENRQPGDVSAALAELGTNAIPELIDTLDWHPGPLQDLINRSRGSERPWLERRLRPWRTVDAVGVQSQAALGLGLLGHEARGAIPTLLGHIAPPGRGGTPYTLYLALLEIAPDDPNVRRAVVQALGALPDRRWALEGMLLAPSLVPEALPEIFRSGSADPVVWPEPATLRVLARHGSNAAPAIPWVTTLLTNVFYGPDAAETLAAMGAPARAALPQIEVWMSANQLAPPYNLLLRLGPAARETEPLLIPYLTHAVPLERLLAAHTLAAIRGDPAAAIPDLLRELRVRGLVNPQDTYMPRHPAFTHSRLGPITLTHRETAAWLLGELGPSAAAAAPALRGAATEESGWLPVLAAWSLWRITHQAPDALPRIGQALNGVDPYQRHFALCAVAEMGPAAARLEPEVRACLRSDLRLRAEAETALATLRPRP